MALSRRELLAAAPLSVAASSWLQDPDKPAATKRTRFAANCEMWWGKLPFLDRIRAAHDLGFPAIEFWPWRGKDVDGIKTLTQELGIDIAQFLAWFGPNLNDPKNHDAFAKAIEESLPVAHKLNTKLMTVIAGNDRDGLSHRELQDHVIAGLSKVAKMCEEADVTLILEPLNIRVDHKGHCLSRSDDAVRICREVGSSHVKINWDLYHQQITEGDLCGHLREGYDQVGYIQIADHPGRTEPGTGEIHYNRVFKELWELGYRGYVGCECRPKTDEKTAAQGLARADVW